MKQEEMSDVLDGLAATLQKFLGRGRGLYSDPGIRDHR
jgi:hypothetical protein